MSKKPDFKSDSYYDILGIDKNADLVTINKSFRELAKIYHPDKNQNNKDSEEIFKKIIEAHEILIDKEKREIYDKYGKDGLQNQGIDQNMDEDSMNEVLKNMGFNFGFDVNNNQNNKKYDHIRCNETITLEEAYTGKHIKKNINRFSVCKICNGTRFNDGKDHTCQKCKGNGIINQMMMIGQGMYSSRQSICPACNGKRTDSDAMACESCAGEGVTEEQYSLDVDIPSGAFNGYMIQVKNEGNQYSGSWDDKDPKRSNIQLIINLADHSLFKHSFRINGYNNVSPCDLLYELNIGMAEALCGIYEKIKHINGEEITINIPKMTKSGDIFIIKNFGLPIINTKKYGSLYIHVNIKSDDTKELPQTAKKKIWEILKGTSYENRFKNNEKTKLIIPEAVLITDHSTKRNRNPHNMNNMGIPNIGMPMEIPLYMFQ